MWKEGRAERERGIAGARADGRAGVESCFGGNPWVLNPSSTRERCVMTTVLPPLCGRSSLLSPIRAPRGEETALSVCLRNTLHICLCAGPGIDRQTDRQTDRQRDRFERQLSHNGCLKYWPEYWKKPAGLLEPLMPSTGSPQPQHPPYDPCKQSLQQVKDITLVLSLFWFHDPIVPRPPM